MIKMHRIRLGSTNQLVPQGRLNRSRSVFASTVVTQIAASAVPRQHGGEIDAG